MLLGCCCSACRVSRCSYAATAVKQASTHSKVQQATWGGAGGLKRVNHQELSTEQAHTSCLLRLPTRPAVPALRILSCSLCARAAAAVLMLLL